MSQPFDNRDWDLSKIDDLRVENERLKALLASAADALVNENHVWFNEEDPLVQELRKEGRVITQREKALWGLLDDIDAAFDAFRPHMEGFEHFVQCKVQERHQYLVSDGNELYEPSI